MKRMSKPLAVALACLPLAFALPAAAKPSECRQTATEKLKEASPKGYAIYERIKDKKFFLNWISCGEGQLGLPTAVHESVHYITGEIDAYPLVAGGQVKRPQETSKFFAPAKIAGKFKASNIFVSTYLRRGGASSSTEFVYLLDEMNAYTHDLNVAMDLNKARPIRDNVGNRDGLAALMAFFALYAQAAEEKEPSTWSGLQKPEVTNVVSKLWAQAEDAMVASCRIPNFGMDDKAHLKQLCQPKPQASLQKILGRAPVCPSDCLKAPVEAGIHD